MKNLIRRDLQNMQPYASARDEFSGAATVFLDANENPFDDGVNRYPDPFQLELKKKLSEIKDVPIDNLLLGNGSDEVIDLLFRGFCNPGEDYAVAIEPSYGMYDVSAKINGIRMEKVALQSDFTLQMDELLRKTKMAKLIFLCSPNNPTGNSFKREHILRLIEESQGIVVVDEAYIDFSEESSLTDVIETYPRLFILQTLSKAWGMAGIRLGIGLGNPEVIAFLHKIKPPYNINVLTERYALKKLENQEQVKTQIEIIKSERARVANFMTKMEGVEEVFPSDANFILIRIKEATTWYHRLMKHGVIVRNRSLQPLCQNTLRISIGTPEENEKLMSVFNELTKQTA